MIPQAYPLHVATRDGWFLVVGWSLEWDPITVPIDRDDADQRPRVIRPDTVTGWATP